MMQKKKGTHAWAALPLCLCVAFWWCAARMNHGRVIPTPGETAAAFCALFSSAEAWRDVALTLLRGAGGLVCGSAIGILAGIFCGRHPRVHDAVSPVVTLGQSCPPIVWISLLLVWLSLGGTVPFLVAFFSVLPVLFVNTANACRGLDEKWFELAQVYRVSRFRRLTGIVFPGIIQGLAAGFSYAFGITWKVTATAEFFGAQDGIGARIYQSYRNLDLPRLFAWTLAIALLGAGIDAIMVRRLRRK